MKKRNKPIVLVTLLVLMIGAVAFVNFPREMLANKPGDDGHGHDETPQTGQKVEVPDKNSIASSVAGSINKADPRRAQVTAPGAPGAQAAKPLIQVEKPGQAVKPTLSDSSTSTQWYTDETPKELPKTK